MAGLSCDECGDKLPGQGYRVITSARELLGLRTDARNHARLFLGHTARVEVIRTRSYRVEARDV